MGKPHVGPSAYFNALGHACALKMFSIEFGTVRTEAPLT
jgi:hypothetical protein